MIYGDIGDPRGYRRSMRSMGNNDDSSGYKMFEVYVYGLILLKELNGQQTDKTRKNFIKVYKSIGLQIEIETNLH